MIISVYGNVVYTLLINIKIDKGNFFSKWICHFGFNKQFCPKILCISPHKHVWQISYGFDKKIWANLPLKTKCHISFEKKLLLKTQTYHHFGKSIIIKWKRPPLNSSLISKCQKFFAKVSFNNHVDKILPIFDHMTNMNRYGHFSHHLQNVQVDFIN